MKNLVITFALLILCSAILLCQLDVNQMERMSLKVKYTADRMASAASLKTRAESYGLGMIEFSCDEGNDLALAMLMGNLGCDSSYFPSRNDYFTEQARVDMYYFDDTMTARHYVNGVFADSFRFYYGARAGEYVPQFAGSSDVIEKPVVICVLDAGAPRISMKLALGNIRIEKKTIYEYR